MKFCWLDPTTSDQCRQNSECMYRDNKYVHAYVLGSDTHAEHVKHMLYINICTYVYGCMEIILGPQNLKNLEKHKCWQNLTLCIIQ